jgi:ADP-heptose:LPS heptosyltransferase
MIKLPKFFSPTSHKRLCPDVKRVAILRDDHLGDLVYTLPMARALAQQGIETHFFLPDYTRVLAQQYANGNELIHVHAMEQINNIFKDLKVDVLIIPNAKTLVIHRETITKLRRYGAFVIARAQQLRSLWTADALMFLPKKLKFHLHESQINLALLQPVLRDIKHCMQLNQMDMSLPKPQLALDLFSTSVWQQAKFKLLVHLGSNGNGREWPLGRFVALIRELTQQHGVAVWLTGSAKEAERFKAQAPELFEMPQVYSTFGLYSLPEFMSLIAHADGLIANGTGPLHLAGMCGIKSLGLFPNAWRIGAQRWRPLSRFGSTLSASSCSQGCAKNCACIEQISIEQVMNVVQGWLSQSNDSV